MPITPLTVRPENESGPDARQEASDTAVGNKVGVLGNIVGMYVGLLGEVVGIVAGVRASNDVVNVMVAADALIENIVKVLSRITPFL